MFPKLKRDTPVIESIPIVEAKIPKTAINKDFSIDARERYVRMTNPIQIRPKYSGGPNFRAKDVRGNANRIVPQIAIVPAIKDPKAEMPRAGPALPFLAMAFPSRQVTMVVASPGTFNKIDVMEPPY
jgi:hypothetical protein